MIRVVTDSTANISPDIRRKYGIEVVPLRVIFPDATYRDSVDLSVEDFYQKLATSTPLPTTSQPPVAEFEEVFERLTSAGDSVLAVLISSKLSGTVASAEAAKQHLPDAPIHIFDSYQTSGPLHLMVEYACEQAAAGAALETIVAGLETLRSRIRTYFVVDTLEYLQKGGRIGGAAALAGSLLRLKPVLVLEDGAVDAWAKIRGKRKAVQVALESIREHVGTGASVRAMVVHSQCEREAREFAQQAQKALQCPSIAISELSPVIGVHVGPGVLGATACNLEWVQ